MSRISILIAPVAVATLGLGIPQADAARVDLDVNAIHVDAGGSFDSEFTGTLLVNDTDNTQLVSIALNDQELLNGQLPASLNGSIDLTNGTVNGGFLRLVTVGGDAYDATIRANSGSVVQAIGDGGLYQLGGLTFDGEFSDGDGDGLFAGVDLGGLQFGDNLPGNFLVLDYRPNDAGQDVADIEIRAVPLPSAALLGAPLVLGLPVLRRTFNRIRG